MAAWNSAGSSFGFTISGTSSSSAGAVKDGVNVCSFDDIGDDGTIGRNSKWFYPETGEIIESDVVFNTHFTWSVSGEADKMDVQNIATHEFGHSLSLDDLYDPADSEKTMYGYSEAGEIKLRTLDPDDVAGINHLYSPALVVSNTTLQVPEGGSNTFTVRLSSQPAGSLTVNTARSAGDTDLTVSANSSLTFTTANWDTPQTATIAAAQDADAVNDSATFTVSTAGLASLTVTANEADDDVASVAVIETGGSTAVTEGGAPDYYNLKLTSQPKAEVTITPQPDSQVSMSPSSVTFTSSNWSTPRTVTVTAIDDAVIEGIHSGKITHIVASTDPGYAGISAADVNATITDNDSADIIVTPTSGLVTTEAGETASFTIALTVQPSAEVTIWLSSSDTTEGTVNPASVTFNASNWNRPQTVTVTGIEDSLADGNIAYSIITAPATSQDGNFNGLDASDVSVTNTDHITQVASSANSTVTATPSTVSADGLSAATITVTLKDAGNTPVAGKTVTLASSRGAADTIPAASGPSNDSGVVTFTVTSLTAGPAVFTATDTSDGVPLTQKVTVTFLTPTPSSSFTYTTANGAITITGYTGSGGVVAIPTSINGLPVTQIGDNAFKNKKSLTSVTISGWVTSIGSNAFSFCDKLTSVTIPASVTSIGDMAFWYCIGLISVTIPGNVASIGYNAFGYCTSLTSITVDPINADYCSSSGVLFDKLQTTLIQFPGGKPGFYLIPNKVFNIANSAFSHARSLTSVTIPDSVTCIGILAFWDCPGLSSVTIPGNVTIIGSDAFGLCQSLASIEVDPANTNFSSIGGVLFDKAKTALVRFPCGKAGPYVIPTTVTSLVGRAFNSCKSLTSVIIPVGFTSIEGYSFQSCTSLTSVTIPDSVTSIGMFAFASCTSLTGVNIPPSVTSIDNFAFSSSSKFASAVFFGNAPTMGNGVFSGDAARFTVYYYNGLTGFTSPTWNGYPSVNLGNLVPSIATQPASLTINSGSIAVLEVIANGTQPITYRWYCGNSGDTSTPVGANSFTFTTPALTASTSYWVNVSNVANQKGVNSNTATVTVAQPAAIVTEPRSAMIDYGLSATLTVVASGTAPLTYQWYQGSLGDTSTPVGGNSATFVTPVLSTTTCYWVNVSNMANPAGVNSIAAKVTVRPLPVLFTSDGTSVTIIGYTGSGGALSIPALINALPVVAIAPNAFSGCALSSVTIPTSVTTIGDGAFNSCSGLTRAVFLGDAPAVGQDAFVNTASGFTVNHFDGSTGFSASVWMGCQTVNMGASNSVTQWLVTHGLAYNADMQSDPNDDGVNLLMAYALNLNPDQILGEDMPLPTYFSGQIIWSFYGGRTDVAYAVQTTTDLQTWTSDGVNLSVPGSDGMRTATAPMTGPSRFMRIVVSR